MIVTLPAFDTPDLALTPLVLDALKDKGTTSRPHASDAQLIEIVFGDAKKAAAFQAAVDAILKPALPAPEAALAPEPKAEPTAPDKE